jgi:hypothetical protein
VGAGRAKSGRAKVSVALHPRLVNGDLRSPPPWPRLSHDGHDVRRSAAKVPRQSGGLAAGRTFSSDFGPFLSGELPKCAHAALDWQLAATPTRWKPASGTSAALVTRTPLRMCGHGCALRPDMCDAERYAAGVVSGVGGAGAAGVAQRCRAFQRSPLPALARRCPPSTRRCPPLPAVNPPLPAVNPKSHPPLKARSPHDPPLKARRSKPASQSVDRLPAGQLLQGTIQIRAPDSSTVASSRRFS